MKSVLSTLTTFFIATSVYGVEEPTKAEVLPGVTSNQTKKILPQVILPYDSSKIDTLSVGTGIIESQMHFFGARGIAIGNDGLNGTITYTGERYEHSSRNVRDLQRYFIPKIQLSRDTGKLTYLHDRSYKQDVKNYEDDTSSYEEDDTSYGYEYEDGTPFSREEKESYTRILKEKKESYTHDEILLIQKRLIKSPMETDPNNTLYLDINTGYSRGMLGDNFPEGDTVHLKGSILEITHLPENLKVHKIIIEYLGDSLFRPYSLAYNKTLADFDWNWLSNLRNMLHEDGVIYFEMRADEQLRQKRCVLPAIEEELLELYNHFKETLEKYNNKYGVFVKCNCIEARNTLKLLNTPQMYDKSTYSSSLSDMFFNSVGHTKFKNQLSKKQIDSILKRLYPDDELSKIISDIKEILINEFTKQNYTVEEAKEFRRGCLDHIPSRFYPTIRFKLKPQSK